MSNKSQPLNQHIPKTTHDRPSNQQLPLKKSYASVAHVESSSKETQPSSLVSTKSVQLSEEDLIIVEDTSAVIMIKVKEIDTITNMYHICHSEGFLDVKINYVGGLWVWIQFTSAKSCEAFKSNDSLNKLWTSIKVPSPFFVVDERIIWIEISGLPLCAWGSNAFKKVANLFGRFNFFEVDVEDSMCMGKVCVTTKAHSLISERVIVTIRGVNFNVHVKEIGTWSTQISNDLASNDSDDDCDLKDLRSTNEDDDLNTILDDFVQKSVEKEDGPKEPSQTHHPKGSNSTTDKHDATINEKTTSQVSDDNATPTTEADHIKNEVDEDVSDFSKPPGFEKFVKEENDCAKMTNTFRTGKCSTSFGNYKRKELRGFSFIDEMNRMIEVGGGGALGYDVRGCRKSLTRLINGIGESMVDK
ncbi:hypothetical protein Tco_0940421 [Tanacetum coccineum]|uniref:DUF4283 domain-containing protein n=1 Tax=Tanacetum coccineum TaxID=301880 RepID=A0ABQ5DMZ0_9ASTR